MIATHLPCPHDGCPGLEMHDGKPDGCGHPTITEGCRGLQAERDGLRLAFEVLAAMVREEFPAGVSLAEIVDTWPPTYCGGRPTPDQLAALRALEGGL